MQLNMGETGWVVDLGSTSLPSPFRNIEKSPSAPSQHLNVDSILWCVCLFQVVIHLEDSFELMVGHFIVPQLLSTVWVVH